MSARDQQQRRSFEAQEKEERRIANEEYRPYFSRHAVPFEPFKVPVEIPPRASVNPPTWLLALILAACANLLGICGYIIYQAL